MRAENWELLNGTGWGDEPQRDDVGIVTYEGELEIPGFMFETTQSVLVPAAAFRAQGMGRVKRQERAEKKQRRDYKNGIAYVSLMFGLLVLANLIVEVICR